MNMNPLHTMTMIGTLAVALLQINGDPLELQDDNPAQQVATAAIEHSVTSNGATTNDDILNWLKANAARRGTLQGGALSSSGGGSNGTVHTSAPVLQSQPVYQQVMSAPVLQSQPVYESVQSSPIQETVFLSSPVQSGGSNGNVQTSRPVTVQAFPAVMAAPMSTQFYERPRQPRVQRTRTVQTSTQQVQPVQVQAPPIQVQTVQASPVMAAPLQSTSCPGGVCTTRSTTTTRGGGGGLFQRFRSR